MTILNKMHISQKECIKDMLRSYLRSKITKTSLEFSHLNMAVFCRDPITQEIQESGFFEHQELSLIFSALQISNKINGIALDIGANIGNHSLFFDQFFEGVYAFEPHPLTFQLLKINSLLGKNISVENVGLSDKKEDAIIYNEPYSLGGSSIHPIGAIHALQSHRIALEKLDEMKHLWNKKIHLIKIDVEGHELQVLKGGAGLIKKNMPIIMFEQHLRDFTPNGNKVLDMIKLFGYSRFATINKRFVTGAELDAIDSKFIRRLAVALFGYKVSLDITSDFKPKTYPVIIALPPD